MKRRSTTPRKAAKVTHPVATAPGAAAPRTYTVGYCRPPVAPRFRKGVSGNPRGRPRGFSVARAKELVLQEAYRLVTVREGDAVYCLPAIQAVLRSQVALAVKGNGPAQRAVIATVQAVELEFAIEAALRDHAAPPEMPDRADDDYGSTIAGEPGDDPPRPWEGPASG